MDSYVPESTKLHMLRKAFPANGVYKVALYRYDPESDRYSSKGEIQGQGYQAGGKALQGYVCDTTNGVAYLNFKSPVWANSTIQSASFAVVYNSSDNGVVLTTLAFDETTSKNGEFLLEFPANGPAALISM